MHPTYYRGCWHVVSRCLFLRYCLSSHSRDRVSSPRKAVYTPKGFVPHAASLHQACAHCGIFLTAASRRSLGRVSVPVWLAVLSDQLRIVAMVGLYPTIQLIRRRPLLLPPLPKEERFFYSPRSRTHAVLATLSSCYSPQQGRLPTCYSPVRHYPLRGPFDLHVLSTPPAFVLSQDQTLQTMLLETSSEAP